MKKSYLITLLLLVVLCGKVFSCGESGTYFNIYVPPSNEIEGRDVALIVTAVFNNTTFRIEDTGEDGDTDDSASGVLMAGQSYILYLRDGGVNDDAPHAGDTGVAKQDGDHFIITSNQLVFVSEANKSDWEHDWLPSTNKTSKGNLFYIYANEVEVSPNDINVMAYEANTTVTLTKISKSNSKGTGFTHVGLTHDTVVFTRKISPGQDLIYNFHDGRDVLKPGETYQLQTNKDVTVQYGALYGDEHDGGGYVPSSNGTSSGNQFYLAVPFQDSLQQEIRVVSWSDNNSVLLERYNNGTWVTVKRYDSLNRNRAVEWVGKEAGATYATIFRVTCSANKSITVFEGDWVETGAWNTSDVGSMISSESGATGGTSFLCYMPIPSKQGNINDPLTHQKGLSEGTHAYIFGNKDAISHVTVTDASTGGNKLTRTYSIPKGFYVDCGLDSMDWKNIYNGTGTLNGGANRPYLNINSDVEVSVMVSNHNDNWMMYYGPSMGHDVDCHSVCNVQEIKPGQTCGMKTRLEMKASGINHCSVSQICDDGLKFCSAFLVDSESNTMIPGIISFDSTNHKTLINFILSSDLNVNHTYFITDSAIAQCAMVDGTSIPTNTIHTLQTLFTALVNGYTEMATSTTGVVNTNTDTANFIINADFTASENTVPVNQPVTLCSLSDAGSYIWNFSNGQEASGQCVTYSYDSTAAYPVILTVSHPGGCFATSTQIINVVADETAGIKTADEMNDLKVWSNENNIYAVYTSDENKDAQMIIYNLLGQQIAQNKFAANTLYTKNMDDQPAQYMIVAIKADDKVSARKVFISGTGLNK